MLFRQRIKTVTHVVELLDFVQGSQWDTWAHSFPKDLRSGHFRWADFSSGKLKEGSRVSGVEPPHKYGT